MFLALPMDFQPSKTSKIWRSDFLNTDEKIPGDVRCTIKVSTRPFDVRYRYTFAIKSLVHLESSMRFSHGDFTFEFVSTNNRLTALVVETGSVNISFPPEAPSPGLRDVPILRAAPEPLLPKIQQDVRTLRGALTLWGVLDIDVDQPAVDYFVETNEEDSKVDALGHALKRKPREELTIAAHAPDMLVRCTLARAKFGDYEIPLEFFRRGDDDCYNERYIEAFVNFFFILEYLFGEGQYTSRRLKSNFAKSVALKNAILEARKQANDLAVSRQWNPRIATKYCRLLPNHIIEEIIRLRGVLHHQSFKRRDNWNPGVQRGFEIDARLLFLTCQSLLSTLCIDILFAEEAKKEFLAVPVFTDKNHRIRWVPSA